MKNLLLLLLCLFNVLAYSQNPVLVIEDNNIKIPVSEIDSITFDRITIDSILLNAYVASNIMDRGIMIKGDTYSPSKEVDLQAYRKRVDIKQSDNQIAIIEKLFLARNTKDCDVFWEFGLYTFDDSTFNYLKQKNECKAVGAYEMPLGGNCRYFFNNAMINVTTTFGDGRCNAFGSIRKNCGNYYLHDLNLECDGKVNYGIHDEGQNAEGLYIHEYHNCEITVNSTDSPIGKCIGGGTGLYGKVVIDGCVFENNNTQCEDDCSWHGCNNIGTKTAHFDINVKNSYFKKRLSCQYLATTQTAKVMYVNNSSSEDLAVNNNGGQWIVKKYCNEIRH